MSLPIVLHRLARIELHEAYAWYERQELGLGEEWRAELQSTLSLIQKNPSRYAVVHRNTRHVRMRRFPYAVYYRVETQRIVVISVFHAKRNPRTWQSRS